MAKPFAQRDSVQEDPGSHWPSSYPARPASTIRRRKNPPRIRGASCGSPTLSGHDPEVPYCG